MSNLKAAPLENADSAALAFDNARPLDEPLTPDEIAEVERRVAENGSGSASEELLERLRRKP